MEEETKTRERRRKLWKLLLPLCLIAAAAGALALRSLRGGEEAEPEVVTISTPGESIDILVTEYGVAVNPKRADLIAALDEAGVEHVTIQQLRDKAYSMVGVPDPVQFKDRVVAIMEARDGTILDVVREIKPYSYDG